VVARRARPVRVRVERDLVEEVLGADGDRTEQLGHDVAGEELVPRQRLVLVDAVAEVDARPVGLPSSSALVMLTR
jgi:hypothetical protein